MTNDFATNTTASSRSFPPTSYRLKIVVALILVIALFATLIRLFALNRETSAPLVWVEPGDLTRYMEPGPFTRLKFRILRIGPFWKWYMKGRDQILIDTQLLAITAESAAHLAPFSQCQTNNDGARAWILPPDEFK